MWLNHVALVCSSEENSDRFYQDVFGLNKVSSKILSSALSKQIFDLDEEYPIINYGKGDLKFEIFISSRKDFVEKNLRHVCLEIEDRNAFIKRCEEMDVEILKVEKGESLLVFVRDYDGNIFEIKEKELFES